MKPEEIKVGAVYVGRKGLPRKVTRIYVPRWGQQVRRVSYEQDINGNGCHIGIDSCTLIQFCAWAKQQLPK